MALTQEFTYEDFKSMEFFYGMKTVEMQNGTSISEFSTDCNIGNPKRFSIRSINKHDQLRETWSNTEQSAKNFFKKLND